MPSHFSTQHGSTPITSAVPTVDQPLPTGLAMANGDIYLGERIRAEGLPQANLWVEQTTGAAGVTVSLQFEQLPDAWRNLVAPIAIVPGAITLVNRVLGAANYRVSITNASGGAVTVFYRLSATIPG